MDENMKSLGGSGRVIWHLAVSIFRDPPDDESEGNSFALTLKWDHDVMHPPDNFTAANPPKN